VENDEVKLDFEQVRVYNSIKSLWENDEVGFELR
jgi:hypothetical protein